MFRERGAKQIVHDTQVTKTCEPEWLRFLGKNKATSQPIDDKQEESTRVNFWRAWCFKQEECNGANRFATFWNKFVLPATNIVTDMCFRPFICLCLIFILPHDHGSKLKIFEVLQCGRAITSLCKKAFVWTKFCLSFCKEIHCQLTFLVINNNCTWQTKNVFHELYRNPNKNVLRNGFQEDEQRDTWKPGLESLGKSDNLERH